MWQIENIPTPIDWLDDDGQLLFTVGGDQPALYRLDHAGVITPVAALGGQLAASADHLFVYGPTALYQLSETPTVVEAVRSDAVQRWQFARDADGSLLLAHHGLNDVRLIALRAGWFAALGTIAPAIDAGRAAVGGHP